MVDLGSVIILTILAMALPYFLLVCGAFVKISMVLNVLKTAIGLQTSPSSLILNVLAFSMSVVIMYPVYSACYDEYRSDVENGEISLSSLSFTGIGKAMAPLTHFMEENTDEIIFERFVGFYAEREVVMEDQRGWSRLVYLAPVYLLSELKNAFVLGVYISLPFLVVDLVVTAMLLMLGAIMVSPTSVALPLKLLFFVSVDGWAKLAEALFYSYLTIH